MNGIIDFFAGGALRLKALLIGALLMLAACLGLTVWALIERSGKLSAEKDLAVSAAQIGVLSASLNRQNASIEAVRSAGAAATAGARELVAAAKLANANNASLVLSVREVLNRPAPTKPDGTTAGCEDAWRDIERAAK
jgi:hypothetical protein